MYEVIIGFLAKLLTINLIVFFAVLAIGLTAGPSIYAFFMFKWLKKKGKALGYVGLLFLIGVCGLTIWLVYSIFTGPSGFGPEYEKAEIKQKIGGTLICSSVYTADIHSWDYDITYKYKDTRDSIYEIGSGCYHGEEWEKDEQLKKFGEWLILKTGNRLDGEKLIIGRLNCKTWNEYEISPISIERNKFWKAEKINSSAYYSDSYSKIEKISTDGIIIVVYNFRKAHSKFPKENGKRYIKYKIDCETGTPEMVKIYK